MAQEQGHYPSRTEYWQQLERRPNETDAQYRARLLTMTQGVSNWPGELGDIFGQSRTMAALERLPQGDDESTFGFGLRNFISGTAGRLVNAPANAIGALQADTARGINYLARTPNTSGDAGAMGRAFSANPAAGRAAYSRALAAAPRQDDNQFNFAVNPAAPADGYRPGAFRRAFPQGVAGGRNDPGDFNTVRPRIIATEGPASLGGYNALAYNLPGGRNAAGVSSPRPLTEMTMGQVYDFQRGPMRAQTRNFRHPGDIGSTGVGAYQFESQTLRENAQLTFGNNWRNQPFTSENQDRVAETLYNRIRHNPTMLATTWAAFSGQGTGATPPPNGEILAQAFQQSQAELREAERQALQPWSSSFMPPPSPTVPTPEPLQAPDFTAGNEAFAKSAPNNPFAEEGDRNRFLRQNFFRGIGQGMLSVQPGRPIGFGELLMRVGAGGLTGRMEGEDRARQMDEQFDRAMQNYNQARAQRNDQQATVQANVLNQNVAMRNQYSLTQYSAAREDWARFNTASIQGDRFVTTTRPEADGPVQVSSVPITPMVRAGMALRRSESIMAYGSASQSQANWNWQATQAQAAQAAALALAQGGNVGAEALAVETSRQVTGLVDSGTIWQVVPRPIMETYLNDAYRSLGIAPPSGQVTTDAYGRADPDRGSLPNAQREQVNDYIINRLVADILASPDGDLARAVLRSTQGVAAGAVARARETRQTTTRRQGPRGMTTSTTESVSGQ